MTANSSSFSYPGGQTRRFGDLLVRLIDAILNRLFDLRPRMATIRLCLLLFLFLLTGFVITLFYYPLSVWVQYIQDIFGYLLTPGYIPFFSGNPFYNLINYTFTAFTDPRVLQYLPILLASFFIALQTAADYLADVFELDDPSVARHFVRAVALTGSNETLRISQGNVLEAYQNLPVRLIGGPGRVLVDMDSAALFEKPDGTPRVIGPTGRETGGKARLDGFERFRQAIDLRNQTIELRDNDGRSASVAGRSLDGIPITATDVCFVFTVHRNGQIPTASNPFPFEKDAVEKLVYRAASQVRPDLPNPSRFEPSWTGDMVRLVRSRLGGFMNDHRLSEYLASFGQPEVDRINQGEAETVGGVRRLANPADNDLPEARRLQERPPFTPRDQIKFDLFSPFASDFSRTQFERGVELYWIGLGTWMVPTEIVPETRIIPPQYIEAWRISRENLAKGNDISSGYFEREAIVQKFVNLIQEVLVAKHVSATTKAERGVMMKLLLDSYRSQLIQAAEFMRAKGKGVPDVIIRAINCLSKVLGIKWRWDGEVEPDPPNDNNGPSSSDASDEDPIPGRPASPAGGFTSKPETHIGVSEELLYIELVIKAKEEEIANRLIEFERKKLPNSTRREWILRAIERWNKDNR